MKIAVQHIVFLAMALLSSAIVRSSGTSKALPPMYHTRDEKGAMFAVLREASKSRVNDSDAYKDSYSIGDRLVFSAPLYGTQDLDHKGAAPVATLYGESTVIKSGSFANMLTLLHFDCVFANGDHLTGQGLVNWTGTENVAITGGTGTYEGARGTMHRSGGVDNLVLID